MHRRVSIIAILLIFLSASYTQAKILPAKQISDYDLAKSQFLENARQNTSKLSLGNDYLQTLLELSSDINRNRYYSPALGRFISKDPIGFSGDINLYRYANDNPVLFTDPNGTAVPQVIVFTLILQEALALKVTYDFYSTNLYPTCEGLCPGEVAYISKLPPPLAGTSIMVYKPGLCESNTDVFVKYGLLPFGDCAYGLTGF